MTLYSSTETLEQITDAPTLSTDHIEFDPLVRPADLVSGLLGVALCFYALFVFAIVHWQYFGPDVDEVGILGWVAPLVAGAACLLAAVTSVALRASARRADARDEAAA
ncbi:MULTISPECIES: hypothetical protein [unclassified Rathayibacter]|uniref:hypothetical protein n=1 Tax=unclassified Rathayibacter TaxID=2609250 RepID=UPI00188A2A79|nr:MULTISPECIES: hypothetical protein [unclassified Rathayibacter]MBF4461787.1 hypothetical protein [Rathayibacter sp. VKM Ac-2879]MBF4503199.1 hypothetical protein [Rathayibacter sp. VKM Ac-2878]